MQPAFSGASGRRKKAAMSVAGNDGGNREIISQSELLRATKFELQVLLREITASLPRLAEGSHELRIAHYNLHNIRLAIARPQLRPR